MESTKVLQYVKYSGGFWYFGAMKGKADRAESVLGMPGWSSSFMPQSLPREVFRVGGRIYTQVA